MFQANVSNFVLKDIDMDKLFANMAMAKEGKYGLTFINEVMNRFKGMTGETKQAMLARFVLIGMMNDPMYKGDFEKIRVDYFSRPGDGDKAGDRDYVNRIESMLGLGK